MPSTIFHHWFDQFHALPEKRRRWIIALLAALAVAAAFALGIAVGRGLGWPNGLARRAHTLAASNTALQGRVQSLEQQQKTSATALAGLRETLASRDSELQKLKRQQTLYAKLIGLDGGRSGLGVHSIALSPVRGTTAWNFVATLVNTAENADSARGTLTLSVEGVRGGKLVTLGWPDLAGANATHGVPYAFKFFQQVNGSFMLPKGLVPNRITITLHQKHGSDVTRTVGWEAATTGAHGIAAKTP